LIACVSSGQSKQAKQEMQNLIDSFTPLLTTQENVTLTSQEDANSPPIIDGVDLGLRLANDHDTSLVENKSSRWPERGDIDLEFPKEQKPPHKMKTRELMNQVFCSLKRPSTTSASACDANMSIDFDQELYSKESLLWMETPRNTNRASEVISVGSMMDDSYYLSDILGDSLSTRTDGSSPIDY